MNDIYDETVDVYSFAICLIAMIRAEDSVVKFFFNGLRKEMKKKTFNGIGITVLNNRLHNRGFRPKLPKMLYPSLAKLITDCWSPKGADRPSFTEIIARLRGEITMEIMLQPEPVMRWVGDAEADNVDFVEVVDAPNHTMNNDEMREMIDTLEDKVKLGEEKLEEEKKKFEVMAERLEKYLVTSGETS